MQNKRTADSRWGTSTLNDTNNFLWCTSSSWKMKGKCIVSRALPWAIHSVKRILILMTCLERTAKTSTVSWMKTQSRAIPRRFQSKLKLKEFFLGCLRRKGWKPFIKCQSKLDQTAPLILEPKPFKANHLLWALPASHSREVMARTKCPGSRWCPVNQSSNASSFLNHNSKTEAALKGRKMF